MIKSLKGIWEVFSEIKYTLTAKQRRQALLLLLLMLVSSFFELLGVSAIVPFVQAILNPQELLGNRYVLTIWNVLRLKDYNSLILILGMLLVIVYLTKNAFVVFVSAMRYKYATQWQKDISVTMLESYLKRPYSYFMNVNSADILRGCSDDIQAFYEVLNMVFVFIMETVTATVIFIYLIIADAFTAICVLVLMLCILLGLTLLLKPTVKRLGKVAKKALSERNKSITQTVQGIKDIIVMQRKDLFVNAYADAAELARVTNKKYNIIRSLPDRVTEGVCLSGIIMVVSVRIIIGDDSMTEFVPKLAAFAMASFKVLPSVGKITNALNSMIFSKPMQHNVYENIKEAREYDKQLRGISEISNDSEYGIKSTVENFDKNGFTVKLNEIKWKYEGQQKNVLDGLSLEIKKGESVGFIGPSGAGKTTTSDILLGLLKPQSGEVSINGVDVFSMPKTWAQIVGYVPQSVFLMDDTVRKNVAFGIKDVNDDEIWDALRRAQLADFIASLPDGLGTVVGERGIKFSGGQRQRIAIARALFNKPLILVLDEATASLDNETENAVMESIEALQGQMTMVIIAHRLTTIRKCDRVYEISNGTSRIVSHDELKGKK